MAQYFIVKHDLESFTVLPGFIWRTDILPPKMPIGFRQINLGDRWIEFAYIEDEHERQSCSLITGFRQCTREKWYGDVPSHAWKGKGWMIEGKKSGDQPRHPVTVPPINELLGYRVVGPRTIIRITREEFERIRKETFRRYLDPNTIPILRREPRNEQEVLSVVVGAYKKLGIEEILWVRTRFPDVLVKINGKQLYLELEVYSGGFRAHFDQLERITKGKLKGKLAARFKDDSKPVAVLCWTDDDKEYLKKRVPYLKVYELQSLLRSQRTID